MGLGSASGTNTLECAVKKKLSTVPTDAYKKYKPTQMYETVLHSTKEELN